MTYEMKRSSFEGYAYLASHELIMPLNEAITKNAKLNRPLTHRMINDIVKLNFPTSRGEMGGITADGYEWFHTSYIELNGNSFAVLHPWSQDWDHPTTPMDRSAHVYAQMPLLDWSMRAVIDPLARTIDRFATHDIKGVRRPGYGGMPEFLTRFRG